MLQMLAPRGRLTSIVSVSCHDSTDRVIRHALSKQLHRDLRPGRYLLQKAARNLPGSRLKVKQIVEDFTNKRLE